MRRLHPNIILATVIALALSLYALCPSFAQQQPPGGDGTRLLCAYNTSPPTIATGNLALVQCDANGNLLYSPSGTGTSNVAITSPLPSGTNTIGTVALSPLTTSPLSHAASTNNTGTSLLLNTGSRSFYSAKVDAIAGTIGTGGFLVLVAASTVPTTGALSNVVDWCQFTAVTGCSVSHGGTFAVNYSPGIYAVITSAATPFTYTTGVLTGAIEGDSR